MTVTRVHTPGQKQIVASQDCLGAWPPPPLSSHPVTAGRRPRKAREGKDPGPPILCRGPSSCGSQHVEPDGSPSKVESAPE